MKKSLYFAAPLFNPQELAFNGCLSGILEEVFTVYLPQRDGILLPGKDITQEEFRKLSADVFEFDTDAIRQADVFFAVLDGRSVDEGVAFELGYASALRKRCVAFRSDNRVLLKHGLNPMLMHAVARIFTSTDDVRAWVATNHAADDCSQLDGREG